MVGFWSRCSIWLMVWMGLGCFSSWVTASPLQEASKAETIVDEATASGPQKGVELEPPLSGHDAASSSADSEATSWDNTSKVRDAMPEDAAPSVKPSEEVQATEVEVTKEVITPQSIDEKIQQNKSHQEKLETDKQRAQKELAEASTQIAKDYAEAKLSLEKYRQAVAKHSATGFGQLKPMFDRYQDIQHRMQVLSKKLAQNPELSAGQLIEIYDEIREIWRQLVDGGLIMYEVVFEEGDVVTPPAKDAVLFSRLPDADKVQYDDLIATAQKEYQDYAAQKRGAIEARIDQYFLILEKVSNVRAMVLARLDVSSLIANSGGEFFDDLSREVFAIPFRIVGMGFRRYVEVKNDIQSGVMGYWALLKKLFLLSVLILIPMAARFVSQKTMWLLDEYRRQLVKKGMIGASSFRTFKKAIWIQRLTPYFPLVFYLICLEMTASVIVGTVYQDLNLFLPLVQYVLLYKIFRLIVAGLVNSLRSLANLTSFETRNLVNSTTKIIGKFFLIAFSLMHLTNSAVDQGLVYGFVSISIKILGVAVCCYAVTHWKEFLIPVGKTTLPPKLAEVLSRYCSGPFAICFCLPTLMIVVIKTSSESAWEWLSDWEYSKKILTRIYRKKIESLGANVPEASKESLPREYSDLFKYSLEIPDEFLVEANQKQLHLVKKEIDSWLHDNEDEQSMVIYGEKGIGKTTFLHQIARSYSHLRVVTITVPPKTSTKKSITELIGSALQIETTDGLRKSILAYNDETEAKTLILIDDAHNLFVGKVGGFEALKLLIETVNQSTNHIFWCTVFNEYSWAYLKGVFGDSDYLRSEVKLKPWTDSAIRKLITQRHGSSGFQLSYDRMILAARNTNNEAEALSFAEEQFFRLLWEQSGGNPRVALYLWLKSLTVWTGKVFKVGLPERPVVDKLLSLNDNSWFVLSTIVNHENGTRKEIADATNLGAGPVGHALKAAVESKLVYKSPDARYRLSFAYQYDLIRQLKAKNFIYGID